MKEIFGDAWAQLNHGDFNILCITTNGDVKANGEAVMGRGIALECGAQFPQLKQKLGNLIIQNGNIVQILSINKKNNKQLLSFPTKHHWNEPASLDLIIESCKQLCQKISPFDKVLLPRPGCGNGGLSWDHIKQKIEKFLPENVFIISWRGEMHEKFI